MNNVQIVGVDRVQSHLIGFATKMRNQLNDDVSKIGQEVENKLKTEFPEIQDRITGGMVDMFTYQIQTEGLIVCSITGQRVVTTKERYTEYRINKQYYGEFLEPLEPFQTTLVAQYVNEAREQIENSIRAMLA